MTAVICTLLSGAGFYLSLNLGGVWPLAWLAAFPVLWLAFGGRQWWVAYLACWIAYALGSFNVLSTYTGLLPTMTLDS
jgi:hypothetical protein